MRDREPDLERCLGADDMHAKRRKQADHALWNAQRDFGQGSVLANCCAWDAVQPAGEPLELSGLTQTCQFDRRQPLGGKVPRAKRSRSCSSPRR